MSTVAAAVARLERWLEGAPDFVLKRDVRLVLDTLREAEDLRYQLVQLDGKYARLQADVEEIDRRLRGVL